MQQSQEYTINEVSKLLGIKTYKIRLLCSKGLVPNVRHRAAGRRVFTSDQITWLRTLIALRESGMSTAELKKYVSLCRAGNATIAERKAMLETQKRQLWQELEDIQAGIDFIERKNEVFDKVLSGEEKLPSEWF